MRVFAARFKLYFHSQSLKDKRGIVKSILSRARNRFNVAAAEVDLHEKHGAAVLAFVTVAVDGSRARGVLESLETWLVEERPDVEIVAVEIEEM